MHTKNYWVNFNPLHISLRVLGIKTTASPITPKTISYFNPVLELFILFLLCYSAIPICGYFNTFSRDSRNSPAHKPSVKKLFLVFTLWLLYRLDKRDTTLIK